MLRAPRHTGRKRMAQQGTVVPRGCSPAWARGGARQVWARDRGADAHLVAEGGSPAAYHRLDQSDAANNTWRRGCQEAGRRGRLARHTREALAWGRSGMGRTQTMDNKERAQSCRACFQSFHI
jgi:hypothetical protein